MRRLSILASVSVAFVAALWSGSGCVIVNKDDPNKNIVTNPPNSSDIALTGLEGAVDVTVDDRGIPHIYGTSAHDVVMVQGYLMARDRFPQMEIVRRQVTGRLAEFLGAATADPLESDVSARVIGFKRIADKIYDSFAEGDEVKTALDAFAAGVNVYIQELRDGKSHLPKGSGVIELLASQPELLVDWTPQDSVAIGRYLSYSLSYDAGEEVDFTQIRNDVMTVYPAGDARAGLFRDLWAFQPARAVFTRDGFPNLGMDSGTTAVISPSKAGSQKPGKTLQNSFVPNVDALARAKSFLKAATKLAEGLGDETRGSNNWVVSGSKTASQAPLLANDPHLSLPSPPLFWYSHLNTKRAGGDLDVEGISLTGAPGVILGFNDKIAWGATTAGHDVTDVYEETITDNQDGTSTVLFKNDQVAINKIKETIKVANSSDVVIELEEVPHHGIIIPTLENGMVVPRTSNKGISVRWTGDAVSNEIGAFLGLNKATTLDEAKKALDLFEVGAQSFVIATAEGDIFWSTQSKMPVRDANAMTYDPATMMGNAPAFVLPGDGSCEWTGFLEERYIPHDLNPAKGFIATANNDLIGTTADDNPFNDAHYAAWSNDLGHRIARITERLDELTQKGSVTPEDMMSVQGDHQSALGRLLSPAFVMVGKKVAEERATPGSHPELAALVAGAGAADLDLLADAIARMEAWTFETPAGVDIGDGEPSAAEIDDSIATSLFNAAMIHVVNLAFGDEGDAVGHRPGSSNAAKALQWAILEPEKMATYDAALMDTVLWDNVKTDMVQETRDQIIAQGMLEALVTLKSKLGDDIKAWQWGKLHTLKLTAMVPELAGESLATIPKPGDATFPNGFPRAGDNYGIDASNFGMWNPTKYSYGSGPVQRLVVEMTKEGPKAWNALPGGQQYDPDGAHHADEMELWRRNQANPMYFIDADVDAHKESTLRFIP